jgi:CYTH domain-containing protein
MASEIERKFLVKRESWPAPASPGVIYRQGYLSVVPERTVRVRIAGNEAFLTIKGLTRGIERIELEYPIPVEDGSVMLDELCIKPLIEKTRYRIPVGGMVWEVDEFAGDNAGLLLAEVELPTARTLVAIPPWAGAEVSDDPRYFNSNLATNPYSRWKDDVGR